MTITMTMTKAKYFRIIKMKETKPSAPLLYPNITSFSEQYKNDKFLANKKFNNNIKNIKDIINYYETETNNYNKNLSRYTNYFNVAEITEILLSSISTTTTTSHHQLH